MGSQFLRQSKERAGEWREAWTDIVDRSRCLLGCSITRDRIVDFHYDATVVNHRSGSLLLVVTKYAGRVPDIAFAETRMHDCVPGLCTRMHAVLVHSHAQAIFLPTSRYAVHHDYKVVTIYTLTPHTYRSSMCMHEASVPA